MNNHTGQIKITCHAQKRLEERVKTYGEYKSWKQLVKKARYSGASEFQMTKEQYEYVLRHFNQYNFTNSMRIRYFEGFFYVFRGNCGHARTLVTVVKYEPSC